MAVTEEEGGRLNAFAKEPAIQVINKDTSNNRGSQIFLLFGILVLIGLIALTVTIS